jgi:nitrate/nitrite transporter NarK
MQPLLNILESFRDLARPLGGLVLSHFGDRYGRRRVFLAFTIFSGTAPLVATSLIRSTGLSTAPAFVMVACGLFTLLGSLGLSRDGGYVLEGAGKGAVGAQHAG